METNKSSETIRKELAERMAQQLTDNADISSLMECFYEVQCQYFNSMSYLDLVEEANWLNVEIFAK
jgi:predicted transcriptional regulator